MENSPKITALDIPTANPFASQKDLIRFARRADRRFAVTDAYVEKMESVFAVPFELCPNIITDDFFIEPSARKAPDGYFQFVNVAILDERKNQQLLIRSFASNYAGNDHYRLVIAGDGKLYNDLKALVEELGVSNQVRITGFLNRSELVDVLDQSHCFVLASKSETFGVVVIEAMARGIPAISSDIDGTREIINDSNGMLFEEGNQKSLGEVLEKMVQNYSIYQPSIIIQNVKQKYGPDASFKALFDGD
jgi:glycosyltransferase involved in cell wall biosynthesis